MACLASPALAGTLYDFRTSVAAAIDVTPDGSMVAYGLSEVATQDSDGEATLWVQPLPTGKAVQLPGTLDNALQGSDARLRWSPDGSHLAYLAQGGDRRLYLHVWRRGDNKIQVFTARAVSRSSLFFRPQWSPDGRRVYYVAQPTGVADPSPNTAADQDEIIVRQRLRLMFKDTEHDGVTVLSSPAPADAVRTSQFVSVDIVAADTTTGETVSVLTGASVESMELAPDGKNLLVFAPTGYENGVHQEYYDLYIVALPPPYYEEKAGGQPLQTGVRDWRGELKMPAVHKVKQFMVQAAWAPSSDRIAFAEQGALAQGDVFILDLATRKVRNLTAALELPSQLDPGEDVTIRRQYDYPGKFGQSLFPPLWSADGRTLFVLRRDAARDDRDLWALSADRGIAKNLTPDSGFNRAFPLRHEGRIVAGARAGSAVLAVGFGDGNRGFVEIDPVEPRIRTLAKFRNASGGDLNDVRVAERAQRVLFIKESADAPQEIFSLDLRNASLQPVTQVNRAHSAEESGERKLVSWEGKDGREYSELIRLPPAATRPPPPALPPAIMVVYARKPSELPTMLSEQPYIGRSDLYLPPLHKLMLSGYAIMVPQIPTSSDGHTCEQVGVSVEKALDAAAGLVDIQRAAIMGHSFGGWTVNCAITRTDRFKAAISMSGISDFFSQSFSSMPPASTYAVGGGQTAIGKSVWEAPQLYWTESPLSGLQNVRTPLLLMHGKLDIIAPFEQSVEMFTGLSSLGKTVTLVGYDDAGHTGYLNRPDYEARVTEWIGRYLGPVVSDTFIAGPVGRKGSCRRMTSSSSAGVPPAPPPPGA